MLGLIWPAAWVSRLPVVLIESVVARRVLALSAKAILGTVTRAPTTPSQHTMGLECDMRSHSTDSRRRRFLPCLFSNLEETRNEYGPGWMGLLPDRGQLDYASNCH